MQGETDILGIIVPSTDPLFLIVIGLHILVALTCVVSGAVAMLQPKQAGRHPWYGTVYYWGLVAVFASATALALMRWAEDWHLFVLGTLALSAATFGRTARRRRWNKWVELHIIGMGTSYVVMLAAFYIDNGRNLPVWRDLPPVAYWLLPTVIGGALIVRALARHPLARQSGCIAALGKWISESRPRKLAQP